MNIPKPNLLVLWSIVALGVVASSCGNASSILPSDDAGLQDDDPGLMDDDPGMMDDGDFDDGAVDGGLPLGGGPYAVGTLTIVVEHPDLDSLTYELACFGDTATLIPDSTEGVRADAACLALAEPDVASYLVAGPPVDQVCTEIYGGPDTAHIVGSLGGDEIDIVIDRANGCGINTWDLLLADVLPAAIGAR